MKNRKVFIGIALLIAVLLIGVGYAEITDITLKISGSATATPADANFTVKFTGTPSTSGAGNVEATIDTADSTGKTATITVTDLTAKGQVATATYTITNDSPDLSAKLSAVVTENSDTTGYFNVTTAIADTDKILTATEKTTTVTVTVELLKTPVTDNVTSNITVNLTAEPVQPEA